MGNAMSPLARQGFIQRVLALERRKKLSVRLYGKEVGLLRQTETGNLTFTYNEQNETLISQSLPLEKRHFLHKQCAPYFNGLLPEGDEVRKTLAKIFHISAANDFSLLQAIGGDCAGAVSFVPTDTPIKEESFVALDGKKQTEEEWIKFIDELPKRPLGNTADNTRRLSLAGAQDKTSVTVIGNDMLLPKPGTPSTHILKTSIKQLDFSILNEYLCMNTAKVLKLNVPSCIIYNIKQTPVLLVKRYDRIEEKNTVKRIHQEDFCQALGVFSRLKYQADGGPGFKECASLLSVTLSPAKEKLEFAKRVMFNFLIGNNDAHAKNFSLLYNGKKPSLAPAYDLLSTGIYPELTKKMAMRIGSSKEAEWVNKEDWELFCSEIDISFSWFQDTFLQMAKDLPVALRSFTRSQGQFVRLSEEELAWADKLAAYCQKNADTLIARLNTSL